MKHRIPHFNRTVATLDRCTVHDQDVSSLNYAPHGYCVYILLFTLWLSAAVGGSLVKKEIIAMPLLGLRSYANCEKKWW